MRARCNRGFTLVEVVVALAIVAIGMLAVFKTIGDTVNNVSYLRDRSFAAWIADNRITEIRLSGEMPSVDETAGELDYAGRHWHWVTRVSQTPVEGLRRIDVSVRREGDAEDSALVSLAGFVGATAMAAPPSGRSWNRGEASGGENGGEDEEEVESGGVE
ncbi:MAG: type II secretion system minor pseudopilin GspI [Steroidobacteraceae bacterium]